MIQRRRALHHDIAVHPKSHSLLVQPVGLTVVEMYSVGKIYIRTPPTPPTPPRSAPSTPPVIEITTPSRSVHDPPRPLTSSAFQASRP